ncbi:hypothetical protein AB1Y20_006824 [Prymnesium parvum]|uniref:HSF-type DNA-binding domain-containing protein n=1 Tax=Prymnesium parvum TaxID=97485 RepID=A0AB34J0S5_PRYPA
MDPLPAERPKASKGPVDPNEPKPFLAKLYKMVDDPETDHIITWLPSGDGLIIQEVESFVSMLLPQYFKHSNLSSFVRQLNTYGFSKVGPDAWIFAHPHFRRGDLESLNLIQRKSSHRPANAQASGSAEAADDQDAQGVEGEGADDEMRRELLAMRNHHASMAQRIADLSEQIKVARAKQASTKSAISKIMTFLSQVYNANQTEISNLEGNAFSHTMTTKRRRIEDHSQITPLLETLAPSLVSEGSVRSPQPSLDLGSISEASLPALAALPTLAPLPAQSATTSLDSPSWSSALKLGRTPSLGQQAALALPSDLQEIALQLIDDTDLQDQCLKEVREGMTNIDGANGQKNDDLESFLWDFLETSQDAVMEHQSGDLSLP